MYEYLRRPKHVPGGATGTSTYEYLRRSTNYIATVVQVQKEITAVLADIPAAWSLQIQPSLNGGCRRRAAFAKALASLLNYIATVVGKT